MLAARVVVLVAEGFEDLEFWVTVMRLREEGAAVTIVGTKADPPREERARGHQRRRRTDVSADDFDAVVVPGGWAPDKLRRTRR